MSIMERLSKDKVSQTGSVPIIRDGFKWELQQQLFQGPTKHKQNRHTLNEFLTAVDMNVAIF
jgi:hypothetical protein